MKNLFQLFPLLIFGIFLTLIGLTVNAEENNTKFIRDDATGGDCYLIGVWDQPTKTCTLTTDVYETIQIDSDYMVLDGNNHTVIGSSVPGTQGIYLFQKTGVTVKITNVENFSAGISLWYSNGNTLINNSIKNNFSGIYLILYSNNNKLIENKILNNAIGIALQASVNNNQLIGNTISGGGHGVFSRYSNYNLLMNNTISNSYYGVNFFDSHNNKIYNNNFINNRFQAYIEASIGNIFNLEKPIGGNYWSDFDSPTEGCEDINSDDFCDSSYYFTGGVDYLPWTRRDGWKPKPVVPAIIDVKPDTLNKKSRSDKNAVTVYIEIPGYDINEIKRNTIKMSTIHGSILAQSTPIDIGDYDNDGILDLMVKFGRDIVNEIVSTGDNIEITISGEIREIIFRGNDKIRVIEKQW